MPEFGKTVEIGGIQFFDSARQKASPTNQADADVLIQYLGHLRFYAKGADQWGEVCRRRGMFDKARRAKVGLLKEENRLVLLPALSTDMTAVPISWTARQRSGEMRLRSAFLHYGIQMRRDSAWMLQGSIEEYPEIGWALVIDLSEALQETETVKKAAGGQG